MVTVTTDRAAAPASPRDPLGGDCLPMELLVDIAVGLARVPALWELHVVHGEARRTVRLLATESYEAWVTTWADDGAPGAHDHGTSAGATVVLEGELVERGGDGDAPRRLPAGSVARHRVGAPHQLVASAGRATTVQVFSPPLRVVRHVDDDGAISGIDLVAEVSAVHDAASYVRALDSHDRVASAPHGRPA